jgi:hypothetical protein
MEKTLDKITLARRKSFKIFFIGFNKTGTVSLLHLFWDILGYEGKVIHGGGATRERQNYDLMGITDQTKDLSEEFDRLGDKLLNQWVVYLDTNWISDNFETLYKNYPNAKFIFNTRNEDDWVESNKRHRSQLSEETRKEGNWEDFDEKSERDYHRKHTKRVLDFFEDKPDELLVLDICGGDGYDKLCPFLGIDIPDEPLPYRHKRSRPYFAHFRRPKVNGFWYGSELGDIEKLCINSWIKNGYEFHLWLYDDIEVPNGVVVKNANDIVSLDQYFTYTKGHTKNTPVAFSNLFRAHLLYKLSGLYVDLDVLCIQPQNFTERFVFTEQGNKLLYDHHLQTGHDEDYSLMAQVGTCLIYAQDKGEQIFEDWIDWIGSLKTTSVSHGGLGPDLLTKLVIEYDFQEYVLPKWKYCPIDWESHKNIWKYRPNSYGIHLYSSIWDDEDHKNIDKLR